MTKKSLFKYIPTMIICDEGRARNGFVPCGVGTESPLHGNLLDPCIYMALCKCPQIFVIVFYDYNCC